MVNRAPRGNHNLTLDVEKNRELNQFYRFFVLLTLTTLSLAIQYPSKSESILLNIFQIVSWVFLLMTAINTLVLAYGQASEWNGWFKKYLSQRSTAYIFLSGLILQMTIRAIALFI